MFRRRRAVGPADEIGPVDAPRGRLGRRRAAVYEDPAAVGPTGGGRAATAVAGGGLLLMRLVRLIAAVVVGLIALAILLVVLDASTSNTIVFHIRDWAHTLDTPFKGIFSVKSAKGTLALNYGIAIVVYLVLAALSDRVIAMIFAPARRRAVV